MSFADKMNFFNLLISNLSSSASVTDAATAA